VLCGGLNSLDEAGKYLSPTIVLNPEADSQMMREEIFGPILPILTYKSFD